MVKILISGICGHMGRNVLELAQADSAVKVLCGVDLSAGELCGVPVYAGFDGVAEKADVVIDFSSAANLSNVLAYAERTGAAVILALCNADLKCAGMDRSVLYVGSDEKEAGRIVGEVKKYFARKSGGKK